MDSPNRLERGLPGSDISSLTQRFPLFNKLNKKSEDAKMVRKPTKSWSPQSRKTSSVKISLLLMFGFAVWYLSASMRYKSKVIRVLPQSKQLAKYPTCNPRSLVNLPPKEAKHNTFYKDMRNYSCRQLGTNYGGFYVPNDLKLPEKPIMLSFGCGEDISFDIAMAKLYGAIVHLFDPTPRAIVHVKSVLNLVENGVIPNKIKGKPDQYLAYDGQEHEISAQYNAHEFFQTIRDAQFLSCQFTFHPWALANSDGEMSFLAPESGVSHSLKSGVKTSTSLRVPTKRFETILNKLKLHHVDVLKIDIEGSELDVIPDLIETFTRLWKNKQDWPKVLFFDMDSLLTHHAAYDEAGGKHALELLEKVGYERLQVVGPGEADYTLVLKPLDM